MVSPISLDALSAAARRAADPASPEPARMMAARGLAPMPPRDLITAQFVLTFDAKPQIADTAKKSLQNLDPRLANAVLADTALSPHVLGYLAEQLVGRDADLEKILLNASTPDSAFIAAATSGSEAICEVIANNQARLLKVPDIARALTVNAKALKSTIDRVVDFLVRNNVILDGVAEFDQAFMRLTGEERLKAADQVDLPIELLDERFLSEEEKAFLGEERRLIADDEDLPESEEQEDVPLEKLIKTMTTGQKVALATKGNKSVRTMLIRDSNRVVALAAIGSPAITENEAINAANSRTVHQDVIAYISRNKDWIKIYQIKVALTNNPKCPLPISMKLVQTLNRRDLKSLAASKNVPAGVRTLAMKLSKTREA